MKRFCLILAAAAAMVSCSKDNASVEKAPKNFTFSATISDIAQTKTAIGEKDSDGKFPIVWKGKDSISVFSISDQPANEKFVLCAGAGTVSASFTGSCQESATGYYAIYPFSKNNSLDEDDLYTEWKGAEQTATIDSWDPSKAVMLAYAKSADDVELSFENICSFVKFTIDYPCKSITFASNDSSDEIACDGFTTEYEKATEKDTFLIDDMENATSSITLKADETGIIEPGTYYIATIPEYLMSGFTMTFRSVNGNAGTTRSTNKEVDLERSHILNLGTMDISSDMVDFAGSGTESDPYQVSNLQELKLVASVTNGGVKGFENPFYIQTADIDCNGETLTPIGNAAHNFAGKYDGNGHKISNAVYGHFTNDGMKASGLFGDIYNATIKNLTVENCTIKSDDPSLNPKIVFGLIAAHAYGSSTSKCTITNCSASGKVSYDSTTDDKGAYQAGGILGASNANLEITYCTNEATFDNFYVQKLVDASIGGILGYAGPVKYKPDNTPDSDALVKIDRCRNNGDITYQLHDESDYAVVAAGGIIGRSYDAWNHEVAVQVSNCVNTGLVGQIYDIYASSCAGGIFGENDSDGSMSMLPSVFNCLNKGSVQNYSKNGFAGGIIGFNYDGDTTISMCVHAGHCYFKYNIHKGMVSGSQSGTYHHLFNTDANGLSIVYNTSDSVFTDGTGYYSQLSPYTLNSYISENYSDKDAAEWVYAAETGTELDLKW